MPNGAQISLDCIKLPTALRWSYLDAPCAAQRLKLNCAGG